MLMWVMSDRALPRSFRTMQGFGVHTFRLVNARGQSRFVKFHWTPGGRDPLPGLGRERQDRRRRSGLHAPRPLGIDRGGRLPRVRAGLPDLHRGAGEQVQLRRARRHQDRPRGAGAGDAGGPHGPRPQPRQLLRRDRAGGLRRPEPGARASTSPTTRCWPGASTPTSTPSSCAWAGPTSTRSRSTRRSPRPTTTSATASTARPSIAAASPTSPTPWAGAAPSRPARDGFTSFPEPIADDKVRGKPEKFADHYSQATLFWNSQTPYEKAHIVRGFRFELTKVQVPAIRERTVSMLRNVSDELAQAVADGLGHPAARSRCPGWWSRRGRRSRRRRRCP